MKLWVDDIRPAPKGWVWAKTFEAAVDFICGPESIEEMSLDHDLGDGPTGYNILCLLESLIFNGFWRKPVPLIHVHSANPVGAKNMLRVIDSIERESRKQEKRREKLRDLTRLSERVEGGYR
jgi:hypothetical protein